jgi:hypothetical protein
MVSQSNSGAGSTTLFSPMLEAAVRLAAQGHYHQFRKRSPEDGFCGGNAEEPLPAECIPYITHLMGTMCILARLGARDEVLAAALLHDYLEDVPDPNGRETIRQAVGATVLELVLAVTEDKSDHLDDSETWERRKREQIERIAAIPDDAVLIKSADLLHNVQSLLTDLEAADHQHIVWQRLNAGPESQLWYFDGVLGAVRDRLPDHPLVSELERTIEQLRLAIDN